MPLTSENQRDLIIDFSLDRISEDIFLASYPATSDDVVDLGRKILEVAATEQVDTEVEHGLLLGFHYGITHSYVGSLLRLANAPWHHSHENIVSALDDLRVPEAADELYKAALADYPYRDYDDSYSLGVKAIWALGNLATEPAIQHLGALRRCGIRTLERNAKQQLVRIARRESATPEVRQAARAAVTARR
jgi:hypothetical protein